MPNPTWLDRLGVQTIIWGEEFSAGLDSTLGEIARLGFKGVEFAQVPAKLGSPAEFERMMRKHDLRLLGMAGGSLPARLEFCRDLSAKPDYLYIQKWGGDAALKAVSEGYMLALHPHHFTRIDSAVRAREEIENAQTDRLVLLPDTAHLYLAGEEFTSVLKKNSTQINVVHLKDWTPVYGWSMFTYARGFTELGMGVVPLEDILPVLKEWVVAAPNRWIVVEQDHTQRKVTQSLNISLQWLKEVRSLSGGDSAVQLSDYCYPAGPVATVSITDQETAADVRRFMHLLSKLNRCLLRITLDSFRNVERLYLTILEELADLLDLKCASIWEINTRADTASLRAFWQPPNQAKLAPHVRVISLANALSGLAVEERGIKYFTDVRNRIQSRVFADEAHITEFRLEGMVCIPIPNYWNLNQPEILINLFPRSHYDVVEAKFLGFQSTTIIDAPLALNPIYNEQELKPHFRFAARQIRQPMGICIERAWEEIRAEVTNEVNWIAPRTRTVDEFVAMLIEPISRWLDCRFTEIYLVDESGIYLTLAAPARSDRSEFKVPSDDPDVGQAWRDKCVMSSGVLLERPPSMTSFLRMPIYGPFPTGREVVGVIACSEKKRSSPERADFNLTDEVVLDAFQAAAGPVIERMRAAKARTDTMRRITHELQGPLTVFRGASKYAVKEMTANQWQFSKDYLQQMRSYIVLMEQIVGKAGFLRIEGGVKLHKTRVLLFEDVILPVISGLDDYLDERGFDKARIDTDRVHDTPHALFLDKLRFQQVVFNLLSNSVKYAQKDPGRFRIEISAKEFGGLIVLVFRDWGTGIPFQMKESIFRQGVRGPNAEDLDAAGDGLGLWLVREIVRAHNGSIIVTECYNPTEFTLTLPASAKVPVFENKTG